jgi:hypothetical protein
LQRETFEQVSIRLPSDTFYFDLWRFILPEENDGLRWTVGDTIDLFALDFERETFTDNDGFELASAACLTAASATLIAAVMIM